MAWREEVDDACWNNVLEGSEAAVELDAFVKRIFFRAFVGDALLSPPSLLLLLFVDTPPSVVAVCWRFLQIVETH